MVTPGTKLVHVLDYFDQPYDPSTTAPLAISMVTVTVTSAQLLNLSTAPVEILPPPGVGFQYFFAGAFYSYRFGTVPYDGDNSSNPQLFLGPLANNVSFDGAGLTALLELTVDSNESGIGTAEQTWTTNATVFGAGPTANQGVYLGVQTGNLTTGDGTLVVTVFYAVV